MEKFTLMPSFMNNEGEQPLNEEENGLGLSEEEPSRTQNYSPTEQDYSPSEPEKREENPEQWKNENASDGENLESFMSFMRTHEARARKVFDKNKK